MLNYAKYKEYIATREFVNIDELLLAQGIMPNTHVRKKAGDQLKKDGFINKGSKLVNGKNRQVWGRSTRGDSLDVQCRRLELLIKRQDQDVRTLEKLLDKGFSRAQCMDYLKMLYSCETELLDRYQEEEKEAQEFSEKVASQANTKFAATRLILCTAFNFYIDKYFPELTSEDRYELNDRKTRASLGCKKEDSARKYEWAALSYHPHFLDLTTKVSDVGDDAAYKEHLVRRFLTPETLDKFFEDGIDYKKLAALCVTARRVAKGEYSAPYGVGPTLAKKMKRHIEGLKEENE